MILLLPWGWPSCLWQGGTVEAVVASRVAKAAPHRIGSVTPAAGLARPGALLPPDVEAFRTHLQAAMDGNHPSFRVDPPASALGFDRLVVLAPGNDQPQGTLQGLPAVASEFSD
jgi:hypothetical protein